MYIQITQWIRWMKSIVVTDRYQKKLRNQSYTGDERTFVRDFSKNRTGVSKNRVTKNHKSA